MATSALWSRDVVALARLLQSRDVSSEEVVRSHLERIEAVDGALRAFVTVRRTEAMAEARALDEERRGGHSRGPLHGLPISVKESIDLEGHASTLGLEARRHDLARSDAAIVTLLRKAGCVVVGRTNVSQLLLFHEARNPLFGQTANPWSRSHTPGGSSGGEAASIAAGMSPLGVGGDIGGSVRIPAHFAGVAAIKPTLDRLPNAGSRGALAGQEAVRSQVGLFTRSAASLAFVWAALDFQVASRLDMRTPPLPATPAVADVNGLRIGVLTEDGILAPSPAVRRAVDEAADFLRAAGAEIERVTLPGIDDAIFDYLAALSSDGGATATALLAGSKVDPSLQALRAVAMLPDGVRRAASRAALIAGQPSLGRLLAAMGRKPVEAFWQLVQRLRDYRETMLSAWDAMGLDAIVCPPHATPALPHKASKDFTLAGSPSMLWNLVQFPAGVVPVTRVRAFEASREAREARRDALSKRAAMVDAESAGLPVGVQVVARPWREDLVLGLMRSIEDAASLREDFPRTPVDPQ